MGHPFVDAPGQLRSLNAARVVALPDDLAGEEAVGRRGIELVSGLRLRRDLVDHADGLGLDPDAPGLLRDFARCLVSPEVPSWSHDVAVDIARSLGRRFGCLLLMLSRGERANRDARPDWGEEQWRCWADTRRIVIGGGLLAGALGDLAVPAAQSVLDAHGSGVRLERSPWGDAITLVGLARMAPIVGERRAVLDFGQTSVKRGLAVYREGRLAGLRALAPRPAPCPGYADLSTDPAEVAGQWEAMLDAIVETVGEMRPGRGAVADLSIALACYLRAGRPDPIELRSCYGRLQVLGPDLVELGRRGLVDRLATDVRFGILDDGTAAALAVDPDDRCVVLTIGTAIGVGFPLARNPRATFEDGFRLDNSLPTGHRRSAAEIPAIDE